MLKIAVDAMGGDHAPAVVVDGAILAAEELGVEICLVGHQETVNRELARRGVRGSTLAVIPAAEAVGMDESPSNALKKKASSMRVAFDMMNRGEVQAVVSAGNSGAMMAIGMFIMGRLPQVDRPAILVVVPTLGQGTIIIDAGANVDCKSRQLVQFGLMGSVYAQRVLGIIKPRVGILSNGEEESKGNDLTRSASEQLSSAPIHYIGYVEGRDIFSGKVDVIVCDGFTGNIALKTMEGVASFAVEVLQGAFRSSFISRLGYLMSRTALRRGLRRMDHAEYGGAPLLGLQGVAIVAHGGSGAKAIKNAIRVAKEAVAHDVNSHIVELLSEFAGVGSEKKDRSPGTIWQRIKSKFDPHDDKSEAEEKGEGQKGGGEGR